MKLREFLRERMSTTYIVGMIAIGAVLGTLLLGLFSGPVTDQGVFQAEKSYAAGWDLRINKELQGGVVNVYSGDTITFGITAVNFDEGGDVISQFTVRDTLPVGMEYAGSWTSNIPGSTVSDPVYDSVNRTIERSVSPLFADESVIITYDVTVSQVGSMENYAELIPVGSMPEESVSYASGPCTSGLNPLNDGEYAVANTNNIDCETITVQAPSVDGECGTDNGESFYLPNRPTQLCLAGTPDVPIHTVDTGWDWNCIGDFGGAVLSCSAIELYCGDNIFQNTEGETCEDGNQIDGDGCSSSCQIEGCTNTAAYNYDPSAVEDNGTCRYCGDGVEETIEGEACDFGTALNTGTCSAVYEGYCDACSDTCESLSVFGGECGDGIVQGPEACDDSNTLGSDGCSADCTTIESGWTCPVEGSACVDDDECNLGTDTCDAQAQCTNEPGTYSCTCNTGFVGDGEICTDIDECNLGTDTCDAQAQCTNEPGTYSCTCNTGYSGNGEICVDDDECNLGTDTCDAQAQCTNEPGTYSCTCNTGFVGDGFTCLEVCGNGIVTMSESCDDGNTIDGDGCSSSCSWEIPTCSLSSLTPTIGLLPLPVSGTIQTESWAVINSLDRGDGTINNTPGTTINYTYNTVGAFDVLASIAHRDNGSITNTCTITVQASTICGNGLQEPGEGCDAGADNGLVCVPGYGEACTYCSRNCELEEQVGEYCGDTILQTREGEACDFGTALNTGSCEAVYEGYCDTCSDTCQSGELFGGECGDGIVQGPEECDDGNDRNDDDCDTSCLLINRFEGSSSSIIDGAFVIPKRKTAKRMTSKDSTEHTAAPCKNKVTVEEETPVEEKTPLVEQDYDERIRDLKEALVGIAKKEIYRPELLELGVHDIVVEKLVPEHAVAPILEIKPSPIVPAFESTTVLEPTTKKQSPQWEVTDTPIEEIVAALRMYRESRGE